MDKNLKNLKIFEISFVIIRRYFLTRRIKLLTPFGRTAKNIEIIKKKICNKRVRINTKNTLERREGKQMHKQRIGKMEAYDCIHLVAGKIQNAKYTKLRGDIRSSETQKRENKEYKRIPDTIPDKNTYLYVLTEKESDLYAEIKKSQKIGADVQKEKRRITKKVSIKEHFLKTGNKIANVRRT